MTMLVRFTAMSKSSVMPLSENLLLSRGLGRQPSGKTATF